MPDGPVELDHEPRSLLGRWWLSRGDGECWLGEFTFADGGDDEAPDYSWCDELDEEHDLVVLAERFVRSDAGWPGLVRYDRRELIVPGWASRYSDDELEDAARPTPDQIRDDEAQVAELDRDLLMYGEAFVDAETGDRIDPADVRRTGPSPEIGPDPSSWPTRPSS